MSDIETASPTPRAGFWRRFAAALIDGIVISVPLQVVVVVLFAMTGGTVQTNTGIVFNNCLRTVQLTNLPQNLVPPPPERANRAVICSATLFGLETARHLTVSRTTKEGIVTKTVSTTYMLDANDHPIQGTSLDWLAFVLVTIYLIALETRRGNTIGKQALGIRVIDVQSQEQIGIPLRKAVIRYALMWAFMVPTLTVLVGYKLLSNGGPEGMMEGSFFIWFVGAGVLGVAWLLWSIIQTARKRDPVYDRIAGTAAVRAAT
jgi:uncharacterized RDD family membrane protein YckC